MEAEFVEWLQKRLPSYERIDVGIGDDAAVLNEVSQAGLVLTSDLLCDGVHFDFASTTPERIGHKALAVNLSDVAAMAARPHAVVISLLWPSDADVDQAMRMYEAMIQLAERYDVAIVGGDTNRWGGGLVISVTVLGEVTERGTLRRATAQVNDAIIVTGQLGGSLLGHHLDFEPRLQEALLLHSHYELNAGMDISDGLSLDLSRLCQESQVGAELDLDRLPISADAEQMSQTSSRTATDHALNDGEDFELLLTLSGSEAERMLTDQPLNVPITRVGVITHEPGLWYRDENGERQRLPVQGFLH